jgi:hypothetical protein
MSRKRRSRPSEDTEWPAFPPSLVDIGLPVGDGLLVHSIIYNKPATTFVAVLQPAKLSPPADQRIFLRSLGEPRYREVGLPHDWASVTGVAVCSDAPVVFLNIMKWTSVERRSANDLGLYRVSLPTGATERLPELADPITAPQSISVVSVLAASADASQLHLIVSVPTFVRVPPQQGYSMGFFLATYSAASGLVEIIDEVLGAFG